MGAEQKRTVVFAHGIQIGGDADIGDYGADTRDHVERRDGVDCVAAKWVHTYWADVAEERTNDWEARAKAALLYLGGPLGVLSGLIAGPLVDLVGDLFVFREASGARAIRAKVREGIENHPNCVVVAHSLGSVIVFDLLREHVEAGRFASPNRDDWPIRALVTFGSPLNLEMFFRQRKQPFSRDFGDWFSWYNYTDRHDPVTNGNVFGRSEEELLFERYEHHAPHLNIKDRVANSGYHVMAHLRYWGHPTVTRRVANLVTT